MLLVGEGAEEFALEQGVVLVPRGYFRTRARMSQLEEDSARPRRIAAAPPGPGHGTVGAVALDRAGNLAAATSTGGLTNKHRGRVGDSPLIGAGTYAQQRQPARCPGTGDGEYFIAPGAGLRHLRAGGVQARDARAGGHRGDPRASSPPPAARAA